MVLALSSHSGKNIKNWIFGCKIADNQPINFSDENRFESSAGPNINESDIELLCKAIYENGEKYMDGTGAIAFARLKQV